MNNCTQRLPLDARRYAHKFDLLRCEAVLEQFWKHNEHVSTIDCRVRPQNPVRFH